MAWERILARSHLMIVGQLKVMVVDVLDVRTAVHQIKLMNHLLNWLLNKLLPKLLVT